jgi:hypothetical protein
MRIIALGVGLLVWVACAPHSASPLHSQTATLTRSDAEQVMLRADDLRRQAFERSGPAPLTDMFAGRALQRLQGQADSHELRSVREEERVFSRDLVFWDPAANEAVLQVVAEGRLVSPDQPNPPWSATVRQWWARLQNVEGWKVVDQEDLPPDRWRPVTPYP